MTLYIIILYISFILKYYISKHIFMDNELELTNNQVSQFNLLTKAKNVLVNTNINYESSESNIIFIGPKKSGKSNIILLIIF